MRIIFEIEEAIKMYQHKNSCLPTVIGLPEEKFNLYLDFLSKATCEKQDNAYYYGDILLGLTNEENIICSSYKYDDRIFYKTVLREQPYYSTNVAVISNNVVINFWV